MNVISRPALYRVKFYSTASNNAVWVDSTYSTEHDAREIADNIANNPHKFNLSLRYADNVRVVRVQ